MNDYMKRLEARAERSRLSGPVSPRRDGGDALEAFLEAALALRECGDWDNLEVGYPARLPSFAELVAEVEQWTAVQRERGGRR